MEDHKIALITGTGGFLGQSICHRLMDTVPETVRLTLIVTSRTFRGVTKAVDELKKYVADNHAERAALVEFDYLVFDQCNMVSVLGATFEVKKRYTHIDYIIFNSSHSQLERIDYAQAARDFFTQPLYSFTVGTFKVQGMSKKSADGLGAVFEANVLAPWFIVNELIPLLENGGKVIWVSSCISLPEFLDMSDLGLEKCAHSYEASKYEMELLHHATYEHLHKKHGIESWMIHPGVFKSTTFVPTLSVFAYWGMMFMFYLCRFFGSANHTIYPYNAANAPVWVVTKADAKKDDLSIKYGSNSSRLGRELLARDPFVGNEAHAQKVYEYVESIRLEWKDKLKDQIVERHLF